MFATQSVSATEEISGDAREVMLTGVEVCLESAWNDTCYASLCTYEPGYVCAEELLDVASQEIRVKCEKTTNKCVGRFFAR